MKASPQERAARKAAFRQMSPPEKLEYIFTYYRLPIALGVIALIVLSFAISRTLTKKDVVLYLGYVNVTVGDDLQGMLAEGFVDGAGMDTRKNEVYAYTGLYLSDDPAAENHEYSYASRLKVLAAVNAKQLDVVLMNREAYDIFSRSGYLLNLSDMISRNIPELSLRLETYFTPNEVILEDNAIEFNLNEAETYSAVTEWVVNGIEITNFPMFADAGFPDSVYLGVIANSQRPSTDLAYIDYLVSTGQ